MNVNHESVMYAQYRMRMYMRSALFAALISVSAFVVLPIGMVPLTMQSLMVQFAALLLPAPYGVISILLYLFVGALGFPVFSQGRGGLAHFVGPTGGYLLGFLVANGFLQLKRSIFIRSRTMLFTGLFLHTVILLALGHVHMVAVASVGSLKAEMISMGLILPSIIKIVIGTLVLDWLIIKRRFRS